MGTKNNAGGQSFIYFYCSNCLEMGQEIHQTKYKFGVSLGSVNLLRRSGGLRRNRECTTNRTHKKGGGAQGNSKKNTRLSAKRGGYATLAQHVRGSRKEFDLQSNCFVE